MTQYNILNVKFSNSQHSKLKSRTKNGTGIINLSSQMIGDYNNGTNFPSNSLLTDTQLKARKAFVNGSSATIKFLKSQLSKMVQLGGFLGRLLVPSIKVCLPSKINVVTPLAKCLLVPLRFMVVASATDAKIRWQK